MDFEALLLQISELEQENRNEAKRLQQEQSFHSATKAQLTQVQTELQNANSSLLELKSKVIELQTMLQTSSKTNDQLKKALSNSKREISLVTESNNKQKEVFDSKVQEFLEKTDTYAKEIRELRVYQSKDELATTLTENKDTIANLQNKVTSQEEAYKQLTTAMVQLQASKQEVDGKLIELEQKVKEAEKEKAKESVADKELEAKRVQQLMQQITSLQEENSTLSSLEEEHREQVDAIISFCNNYRCKNCGSPIPTEEDAPNDDPMVDVDDNEANVEASR